MAAIKAISTACMDFGEISGKPAGLHGKAHAEVQGTVAFN